MTHNEFKIGEEFSCGGSRWRCTDIGTRTIIAVNLQYMKEDPSWYNGPPYAVGELVFDENDMPACNKHPTYIAANGEELPVGAPGTTVINDGRPT